jgi:hypothetical protein
LAANLATRIVSTVLKPSTANWPISTGQAIGRMRAKLSRSEAR